jgi:predicted RNA-binding Zn-ribbon protein involved in translation (DUF1610 family)
MNSTAHFCPGSKTLRSPTPETITCASCGSAVEIWSDELRATCPRCSKTTVRQGEASCLEWCSMGKECVGEAIYSGYMERRSLSIRQQLFQALESAHVPAPAIEQTAKAMGFAERLIHTEDGAWNIAMPALILLGLASAPGLSSSTETGYAAHVTAARKTLLKLGLKMKDIDEICTIIELLDKGESLDSPNFRIVHDAGILSAMQNAGGPAPGHLLTACARDVAAALP